MDGVSLDLVLMKKNRISGKIIGKVLFALLKGLINLQENLKILHRNGSEFELAFGGANTDPISPSPVRHQTF